MDEYDSDDLNGPSTRPAAKAAPDVSAQVIDLVSDEDETDDESLNWPQQSVREAKKPATQALPARKKSRTTVYDETWDWDSAAEEDIPDMREKVKHKTKSRSKAPRHKKQSRADESSDDDNSVPELYTARRQRFQTRRARLKENGLLLPPDYDDINFPGDERFDKLKERPNFGHVKSQRPDEDVPLPESLGVIPAAIAKWLRTYQIEGAAALHKAFVHQRGFILGDEMGLGKTIQCIAFLTALFGKTGDERDADRVEKMRLAGRWYPRVLIIAPTTLIANWQAELQRWGWWATAEYHGIEKAEALNGVEHRHIEVMFTTYQTYQKDMEAINSIEWDCVIADEFHTIKNHRSKVTQAMNNINALCRIGLSGTVVQNNYEEPWTLINWTNPGQVGSLKLWKHTISIPIRTGQSHDATMEQIARCRETSENLANKLLPRFLLRRPKSLIAHEIPKKTDTIVFCPMTPVQAEAYDNFCNSDLVQRIVQASKAGKDIATEAKQWLFSCLTVAQKLSNHAALCVPSIDEEAEKHDREMEILKVTFPDRWRLMYDARDSIRNFTDKDYCGKWLVLKEMLKLWHAGGDKVLIFCSSKRLLMMLSKLFATKTTYTYSYLDGDTKIDERQKIVDDYNSSSDQFIFLISTKAGGVGLNITSANKVVVLDPNWNPAHDLQAQDRAYRIGQTREVQVFRFVASPSIETIIYARQIYKQQQANMVYGSTAERRYWSGVQGDSKRRGELFGLANLLRPHDDGLDLKEIINKTNIAESRAGFKIAALDLEATETNNDEEYIRDSIDNEKGLDALVAEILDEPGNLKKNAEQNTIKSKDPIQAIFNMIGAYTHNNAQVLDSSKVEKQISSRARRADGNYDWSRRRAFDKEQTHDISDGNNMPDYQFNPPEDVQHRQFCSMAKFMGYDDVGEFALTVEQWTQERRIGFLSAFYEHRRAVCAGKG